MKLICLNTWGGRGGKENLLNFFEEHKHVDLFCLQEMWAASHDLIGRSVAGKILNLDTIMTRGVQEISAIMSDYLAYFHPHYENYGIMMLVKKDLQILDEGDFFVHHHKGYIPGPNEDLGHHARNLQWVTIETKAGPRMIINFHGLWNGKGKGDSEHRLTQSDKISTFLKNTTMPHVMCGDFNLTPDTESLKKLEALRMRNLIKEYGITSTRSNLYTKPEKYADYTLVSKDIEVKDFKILPDEVSDHLAMYLDFE
jgi:endonuclease/exonuclease/phosphatase family metal-dependent hydrolase